LERLHGEIRSRAKNSGRLLAKKNLRFFQQEFANIRAKNPGMSNEEIGALAVKEISFGKQRIPFATSIPRQHAESRKVTLPDGTTQPVPTEVRIEAGKNSV